MSNKTLKTLCLILSHVLVVLIAVSATLYVTTNFSLGSSKLEQLENLLLNRFVDGADRTELEDAAAHAMVDALGDRWSYYIPADAYASYLEQKKNAYVGIGVTIQTVETGYHIQKVAAGGPAEEAGLLAGDIIVAVDGNSVAGLNADEGKSLVQGKAGTKVELTIQRAGEEKVISVTRGTVKTPVATAQMLEGNIGLITIANFNSNCASETIAAIKQLQEQGAVALVFDVRNNGGGYAEEMVKLLDHLLPEGELFRTVNYKGEEAVDTSDAACVQLPMAVLVNRYSYSAAEFFAVALHEYEWATVVGEQTSGKGYFQVVYELGDGSAVGVSIGKYFTPSGISLEGVGIAPDVMVDVENDVFNAIYAGTLNPMEDPQILAAIAALKGE